MSLLVHRSQNIEPTVSKQLDIFALSDYLTLLGWIFYFPQTINVYVNRYTRQSQCYEIVIMSVIIALALAFVWAFIEFLFLQFFFSAATRPAIAWLVVESAAWTVLLCTILAVITTLTRFWAWCALLIPVSSIIGIAAFSTFFLIVYLYLSSLLILICVTFFLGIGYGLLYSVVSAYFNIGFPSLIRIATYGIGPAFLACIIFWIAVSSQPFWGQDYMIALVILVTVMSYLGFLIAALRHDYFYWGTHLQVSTSPNKYIMLPRVTQLQSKQVTAYLLEKLSEDWLTGLTMASAIWNYTRQKRAVVDAINYALSHTDPTFILPKLDLIVENGLGYEIRRFKDKKQDRTIDEVITALTLRNLRYSSSFSNIEHKITEQNTWYRVLDKSGIDATPLDLAIDAFRLIGNGEFGEAARILQKIGIEGSNSEILQTANLWAALDTLQKITNIFYVPIDNIPSYEKMPERSLRTVCRIVECLFDILRYSSLYKHCESDTNHQRIIEEIEELLSYVEAELHTIGQISSQHSSHVGNFNANTAGANSGYATINHSYPKAIDIIVANWRAVLNDPLSRPTYVSLLYTTVNPFLYDEPLRNLQIYCKRTAVESRLERAWTKYHLHPVEIVGPTLIGKTSLSHVIRRKFKHITFVNVSLEHLNTNISPVSRIAYAISDALTADDNLTRPKIREIKNEPYRTVERLVRSRCESQNDFHSWGLVLILDDFDYADQIVDRNQYQEFIQFLFYLSESLSNFGLVVLRAAGYQGLFDRHRAEAARSSFPIRLRCIPLLRNHMAYHQDITYRFVNLELPDRLKTLEFWCRFSLGAVEYIRFLTGGHLYLIQLLAWNTVEYYLRAVNDELEYTDPPRNRDPLLTESDVRAILDGQMFIEGLKYYFHRLLAVFSEQRQLACEILSMFNQDIFELSFRDISDSLSSSMNIATNAEVNFVLDILVAQEILSQSADSSHYKRRIELISYFSRLIECQHRLF